MRPLAVVTGGSGGLGAAICHALARAGFDLWLTYREREEAARCVAEAVRRHGAAARTARVDLGDLDAVAAFGAEAAGSDPPPAVLVNCAGEVLRVPAAQLRREQFLGSLRVNCLAPFELSLALATGMRERGDGAIVNVGSILGSVGGHDRVAYSTSKAALVGLTRALAVDLAPHVRVNALLAGLFATDMNAALLADERQLAAVGERIPLRRLGTPEEFAEVVAFLAGPGGRYVTGAAWEVDGGVLARIPLPMGDAR
jgi:NAD(P)-dependent dehydrogenase (short-subunit alcohol dehydrogenase family)